MRQRVVICRKARRGGTLGECSQRTDKSCVGVKTALYGILLFSTVARRICNSPLLFFLSYFFFSLLCPKRLSLEVEHGWQQEQGLHMLCMMYDLFAGKVARDVYLEFLHAYGCEGKDCKPASGVVSCVVLPLFTKAYVRGGIGGPKKWRRRSEERERDGDLMKSGNGTIDKPVRVDGLAASKVV